MKNLMIVVLIAFLLAACAPTGSDPSFICGPDGKVPTDPRVTCGALPAEYATYAGGYSAHLYSEEEGATSQYYYWEASDLEGREDNCVEVGRYTQSAVLQNQPGYGWLPKGSFYCLVQK